MAITDVDLVPLAQRAIADVGHTLAGIRPAQWHDPTPCSDWDVAELAAHVVGGLDTFGAIGEGLEIPETPPALDWASVAAAYEKASGRALTAWMASGALREVYQPPWGETPGRTLVGLMLIETLVHGWDLARATDQPADYATDVVATALELALQYDDTTLRTCDMSGPPVEITDDAPLIDQLAACLGRPI